MKLLFADFDGVLNRHEWVDHAQSNDITPECVQQLNRIIRETGCKIVVSSAWRYMIHGGAMTLKGFNYMMRTHGVIADVFVGFTREDDAKLMIHDERALQVMDYLKMAVGMLGVAPTSYVVVDDIDLGFTKHGLPFVKTEEKVGLTEEKAQEIIDLLNGTTNATADLLAGSV